MTDTWLPALLSHGFWGLNSGPYIMSQVLLSAGPSLIPLAGYFEGTDGSLCLAARPQGLSIMVGLAWDPESGD